MIKGRTVRRISRSILRTPIRSVRWVGRWLDPNYALEREAKSFPHRLSRQRHAQLHAIPGRCGERECRLLAHLVTLAPKGGVIVEIGAYKGRVTAWLVEAAQLRADCPTVVSIDPHVWGTQTDFEKTVVELGLSQRGLQVHIAYSHKIGATWSRPISFLWIDGSHEYDDVRLDIINFAPHVICDGFIAFDDSVGGTFPGVEQAISEWERSHSTYKRIATLRNVSVFRRVA